MTQSPNSSPTAFFEPWKGNDRHRLEPASEYPGTVSIPAHLQDDHKTSFSIRDLPQVSLIVAEEGSGITHFRDWLHKHGAQEKTLNEATESFNAKGDNTTVINFAYLDTPRSELSEDDRQYINELSAAVESKYPAPQQRPTSRIIILCRWLMNLQEEWQSSALLNRSSVFRLPHFDSRELVDFVASFMTKAAAATKVEIPDLSSDDVLVLAKLIKHQIGGQPSLTHQLLSTALRHIPPKWHQDPRACLERLFTDEARRTRKSPPTALRHWKTHLSELMKRDPHVRTLIKGYVRGRTRQSYDELDESDAHLFLAGWVGWNPEGEWGIRSKCHKWWARDLLWEEESR